MQPDTILILLVIFLQISYNDSNSETSSNSERKESKIMKFITIGELLMRLSPPDYEKIRTTSSYVVNFGLLVRVSGQNPDDVLRTTKLDKKMVGNQIKFILLKTPGDAYIEKNLTDEQILEGIFYIYGKEN